MSLKRNNCLSKVGYIINCRRVTLVNSDLPLWTKMRKNRRFRQKCEKIVLLYIKKKRKKKKSVLFDIIVKILLLPWGLAFKNILFRNNHIFASLKKSFNDLMMKSIVLYHVLILTQQTLNVHSTLMYVQITSLTTSINVYPRWFNVDLNLVWH